MHPLKEAKRIFHSGDYSCVLYQDGTVYTSDKKGVAPLVEWIDSSTELTGFAVADKVVGKAAALLFVLAGITAVYAQVLSRTALHKLEQYGVYTEYDKLVDTIINREGTGPCPMEQATAEVDTPQEALPAIKQKMMELRNGK